MNGTFNIFKTMPAYALCVCLAMSCNTAALQVPQPYGSTGIGFSVSDAGEASENGPAYGGTPLTKGIPAASGNLVKLFADDIGVVAFRGTEEYIPVQRLLSPSADNGSWHTSQSYFWPESGSLDFWAWAPAGLNPLFDAGRTSLSFSYSLPSPDPDTGQDAIGQKDMIMTRISASRTDYNGGVPLAFGHPLASILFRGKADSDGTVRSISLHNVSGNGECVFDGTGFVWNEGGEKLSYTQTFDAPISASSASQPITLAGATEGERTFLMIPQTLGDNAELEVVFDNGTDVRSYTHSLAGGIWKAGRSYTYTITLSDTGVKEISVEEVFDGHTKTHVSIGNNSSHNVYLRAMIEANWVDDDGCIVAPCDISREGIINGFNVSSTGGRWTLHTDGFYYYKKAIRPGRKTAELFSSYTPGPAPVDGSHLEITIATQGVEYDTNQRRARAAWGLGIPITGAIE
ncbi:MAG: fimbrillin family protein [Bacteroidales bacterium]|nr:fimbrillin family protein [Bacteroidales bacterium]